MKNPCFQNHDLAKPSKYLLLNYEDDEDGDDDFDQTVEQDFISLYCFYSKRKRKVHRNLFYRCCNNAFMLFVCGPIEGVTV